MLVKALDCSKSNWNENGLQKRRIVRMKSAYIDGLAFERGRKRFHARFHTSLHLRVRVQIDASGCRIQVMRDSVLLQYSTRTPRGTCGIIFSRTPEAFNQGVSGIDKGQR